MDLDHSLKQQHISVKQFDMQEMGVSSSWMSSLMRQPKPWDRLRTRGKEMYGRMHQWVEVVERKRSIKQFVEQACEEEDFDLTSENCEVFIEEMTGSNLEEGNVVADEKENDGHAVEDIKLTELENVVLGEALDHLDKEEDCVSGGGRLALEEEMVVADYDELCNEDGEVVEVVFWL